jgi:hypothetical protein
MAVFPNWDLLAIRMHRKNNPEDELFKVVNYEGRWRLSSVVCVMHTHLVTIEHVPPEDHQIQADRFKERAARMAAKREALLEHLRAAKEIDGPPLNAA